MTAGGAALAARLKPETVRVAARLFALGVTLSAAQAATLKSETTKAWEDYIAGVSERMAVCDVTVEQAVKTGAVGVSEELGEPASIVLEIAQLRGRCVMTTYGRTRYGRTWKY